MDGRRKGKSLLERSRLKTIENLEAVNEDAQKRRNSSKLEDIVRNNIAEKTFANPGLLRPDIKGVTGKGGKVTSLFEGVRFVEEVLKCDKGRKH